MFLHVAHHGVMTDNGYDNEEVVNPHIDDPKQCCYYHRN